MLSKNAGLMNSAPNVLQSRRFCSSPCAVAAHTVPAFLPVLGTARTFYTTLSTFRRVKILIAVLCLTGLKVTTQVLPLSVGLGKWSSTVVRPSLRSAGRSIFTLSLSVTWLENLHKFWNLRLRRFGIEIRGCTYLL
jgi:hypothetical protein